MKKDYNKVIISLIKKIRLRGKFYCAHRNPVRIYFNFFNEILIYGRIYKVL